MRGMSHAFGFRWDKLRQLCRRAVLCAMILPVSSRAQARTIEPGSYVMVASSSADAGSLGNPAFLALTTDGTIAVYDFTDGTVRAFTRQLRPRWNFGRLGAGPGEFGNPTEMIVAGQGDELLVLDASLSRVTRLRQDGRFIGSKGIGRTVPRLVQVGPDAFVCWENVGPKAVFLRCDQDLRSSDTVPLVPTNGPSNFMSTDPVFASAGARGAIVGFRWSDRLTLLDPQYKVRWTVRGPEPIDFATVVEVKANIGVDARVQRIAPRSSRASRAISVDVRSNRVVVAFDGRSEQKGRVLDFFDLQSGRYQTSRVLPVSVADIVSRGDTLLVLERDGEPRISRFIWRSKKE